MYYQQVALSPDGRWLTSPDWDCPLTLWDLFSSDPARRPLTLRGENRDPDGPFPDLRIWDLNASDPAAASFVLRGHQGAVGMVLFSHDSRWLATAGRDQTIRLWDMHAEDPTPRPVVLHGPQAPIERIWFSSDGRWLMSGPKTMDASGVHLWDLSDRELRTRPYYLPGQGLGETVLERRAPIQLGRKMAADPQRRRPRATVGPDGRRPFGHPRCLARVCRYAVGRGLQSGWPLVGHGVALESLLRDETVRLWDFSSPDTGIDCVVLRGYSSHCTSAAFTADSHQLVTRCARWRSSRVGSATGKAHGTGAFCSRTPADAGRTGEVLVAHDTIRDLHNFIEQETCLMFSKPNRRLLCTRLSLEALEARQMLAADIIFAEPELYATDKSLVRVFAADVNGDGILDLIAGRDEGEKSGSVLLGNGDGTFAPEQSFTAGTSSVGGAADFDRDGDVDLGMVAIPAGFSVLLNQGSTENEWNGFSRPSSPIPVDVAAHNVVSGDLNNDENVDVVIGTSNRVAVLLNKGVTDGQWGGFADAVHYQAGEYPYSVAVGHLNGDAFLDIAVGNGISGDISVLLGSGTGTFELLDNYPAEAATGVGDLALEDLDADGDLDAVVLVHYTNDVAVLRGNGDGTFSAAAHYSVSHGVGVITTGDWDRDGDIDIATESDSHDDIDKFEIDLLINNGDATFVRHSDSLIPTTGNEGGMTAADFDGNGATDLVLSGGYGRRDICVFLNLAEPPAAHSVGDSNMDGVFDRFDIVQVMQAAKYETGEAADWSEGDWDGNGTFDRLDIVYALATGQYK